MASSFYNVDPADWVALARAKESRIRVRQFLRSLSLAVDRREGVLKAFATPSASRNPVRFRADGEFSPMELASPLVVPLPRFDRQVECLQSILRSVLAYYRVDPRQTKLASFLERSTDPEDDFFSLRPSPSRRSSHERRIERAALIDGRFAPSFKRTPPWYHGFVRESHFFIQYQCTSPVIIRVEFGNPKTGTTAIHRKLLPNADGNFNFWRYDIARRTLWEDAVGQAIEEENTSDILTLFHFLVWSLTHYGRNPNVRGCARLMDVDADVWGKFKTTDAFRHVRISVLDSGALTVREINIRLNDEVIFDSDTAQTNFRNYRLTSENPIILDREILLNRLKQVGMNEIPSVDDILTTAARHIGESWNPEWPGEWVLNEFSPTLSYWNSVARTWCNEFSSVIINKAMGLDENDDGKSILDDDVNAGTTGMATWFKCFHPTRWIGTTTGTYISASGRSFALQRTPYEDLGDAVHRGFYLTVGQQTHATFFVDWGTYTQLSRPDEKLKFLFKKTDFQKHADNGILTIGGNQGDVVNIEPRAITKAEAINPNVDIYWDKNDIRNSDGFGNAKIRIRMELQNGKH